jgi:hypothetical protein
MIFAAVVSADREAILRKPYETGEARPAGAGRRILHKKERGAFASRFLYAFGSGRIVETRTPHPEERL